MSEDNPQDVRIVLASELTIDGAAIPATVTEFLSKYRSLTPVRGWNKVTIGHQVAWEHPEFAKAFKSYSDDVECAGLIEEPLSNRVLKAFSPPTSPLPFDSPKYNCIMYEFLHLPRLLDVDNEGDVLTQLGKGPSIPGVSAQDRLTVLQHMKTLAKTVGDQYKVRVLDKEGYDYHSSYETEILQMREVPGLILGVVACSDEQFISRVRTLLIYQYTWHDLDQVAELDWNDHDMNLFDYLAHMESIESNLKEDQP